MNWFAGRIDINFRMYCRSCGYTVYPYCDPETKGKSPQQVFEALAQKDCPECDGKQWGHNL